MPNVKLYPTLSLTPFARENLSKLKFHPEQQLCLPEGTFEDLDLNLFGRLVKKVILSESRIVEVICAIVIVVLALSLVGIPLLLLAKREQESIWRNEGKRETTIYLLNEQVTAINDIAWLVEIIGLDIFEKFAFCTSIIQNAARLEPENLRAPLVKGIDAKGCAFLAVKTYDIVKAKSRLFRCFLRLPHTSTSIHQYYTKLFNRDTLSKLIAGQTLDNYRLET